jgi:ecotin
MRWDKTLSNQQTDRRIIMKSICLTLLLSALATIGLAGDEASHWEKAYPSPEKGMVRHVLHLPTLKDESAVKVELIAGKIVETDGVNQYFFGGKIVEQTVEGWGYPRYNVTVGQMGSTLMAPPPNMPKVNKFVAIGGEPMIIRYNSKLPVVVYAPEGVEVRYRIWKADPEGKPIDKG